MIDTCRVFLPGTRGAFNEDTGQYDEGLPTVLYEGPCRVQVRSDINSNAVEAGIGEHEFTYRTATLQLPIAATGIPADAVAHILTCPLDPDQVGREFNIQAETKGKTHATHRRFRIREVVG